MQLQPPSLTQSNKESHTNIYRLAYALKPSDGKGISQIAYYCSGVGASNGVGVGAGASSLFAGVTGAGFLIKVEQIYAFICMNWEPGDEVSGLDVMHQSSF